MHSFQEKKKWRKIMESKLALVIFGICILFFAYSVLGLVFKAIETSKNKELAKEKIIELQKEKQKLTEDLNSLNTDKGKEEAIRDKFGMAKEGENLIVVIDDKNAEEPKKEESSNKFFMFFRNIFK